MKDKLTTIGFVVTLVVILITQVVIPDQTHSYSERRSLSEFPELTFKNIFSGEFSEAFESYALDHVTSRETFKKLKSWSEFNLFFKKDVNDYYTSNGHIVKKLYPYDEDSVQNMVDYLNGIYAAYLEDMNVYYSVIPDKEYFLDLSYKTMDYEDLFDQLNKGLDKMIHIPIEETLSLDDFYFTDPHWNQVKLEKVIRQLEDYIEFDTYAFDEYTLKKLNAFTGAYGSQSSLLTEDDVLEYLEHASFEDLIIKNYEDLNEEMEVYEPGYISGMDPYDVFLSGASPLMDITNPTLDNGKELVVFRDSYGSSVIPLLIGGYEKITLIDTRYMPADLIGDYLEFDNQDVLFLYSTMVVNNSMMLK